MGPRRLLGLPAQDHQEVISLVVFAGFALVYLREPIRWNYAVSAVLVVGAVYFAFYSGFQEKFVLPR